MSAQLDHKGIVYGDLMALIRRLQEDKEEIALSSRKAFASCNGNMVIEEPHSSIQVKKQDLAATDERDKSPTRYKG